VAGFRLKRGTAVVSGSGDPASKSAAYRPLAGNPSDGFLIWDLRSAGYESEEYLIPGAAHVYDSISMADAIDMSRRNPVANGANRNFVRPVVAADRPYTTRVIVYRPADPRKCSGNVVVEVLHIAGGGLPVVFTTTQRAFVANGDVLIGVQHPVTFDAVRAANPSRYTALQAQHPTQIWGMLRDAACLARQGGLRGLDGYRLERQFMAGRSFSGVAVATFANCHHQDARLRDGRNAFDGYLAMTCGYYIRPLDVPVIRINTESDFSIWGLDNRSDDSDAPGSQSRLYEVAGGCHYFSFSPLGDGPGAGAQLPPGAADAALASFGPGTRLNDLPVHLLVAQAFRNLYAWSRGGAAPPRGDRLVADEKAIVRRDQFGNALAGVRLPQLKVPLAGYGCGQGEARHFGYTRPLATEQLRELYGSPAAYLAQLTAAAEQLVNARWIGADAVPAIVEEARRNAVF